jgi:hypothetical protein
LTLTYYLEYRERNDDIKVAERNMNTANFYMMARDRKPLAPRPCSLFPRVA